MTMLELLIVQKALRETAEHHGKEVCEVIKEIQATIDDAWENGDEKAKAFQEELFPNGKPAVEEFVMILLKQL